MSTSKNDGDGEKKPPDTPLRGLEALERLRTATTKDRKEVASVDGGPNQKDTHPNIPRSARRVFSSRVPRNVSIDAQSRKLTEKDRITFWQRVVSRIPKAVADEYNAQVDAELARQQPSSGSGTAHQGSTTSDNNQSTKTSPREKSRGQNKKLWLESFRSWIRKRKSMPTSTTPPAPASGPESAPPTAGSSTPPATGAPATSSAPPAGSSSGSSAGAPDPATSTRSWWDPVWILGLVGIVAIVGVIGALITIVGIYCFRDQNVVSEFKEIARRHDQLAEERRIYESHRAEAEANAAEIRARGGSITTGVPVFNYNINIYMTNSPGHVPNP